MEPSSMYLAEFLGTTFLLLLGNGINMTLSLNKSYGKGGGWMVTCFGWGISVTMAAYLTGWVSGAHLNPALTIALAFDGTLSWKLVPGYILAQILGGLLGATLAYLTYKNLLDEEPSKGTKLGVFATGPAIDNKPWNIVTEMIGTAILVIGILAIGYGKNMVDPGIKPFLVGMLIFISPLILKMVGRMPEQSLFADHIFDMERILDKGGDLTFFAIYACAVLLMSLLCLFLAWKRFQVDR